MSSAPIRFYFDYVSPYAYLASTQIHALAERHGREVELVPVLFAGLLGAHGTIGPAEVAARRVYLVRDTVRLARTLGVPLEPPAEHPFNPLAALRVSSAPMPESGRRELVRSLYSAVWAESRRVADPNVVREIALAVGVPETSLAHASSDEGKARLRAQTDDAIAAGVFGVPSMIVDGELFWGVDSLPHLERFLAGEDPGTTRELARWARVPTGASRRR